METHSFRAPNTQVALEQVQNELGSEAIIISVKQVPPEPSWQVWKSPEIEVIAAPSVSLVPKTMRGGVKPAKSDSFPQSSDANIEAILSQLALRVQQSATSGKTSRVSYIEKFPIQSDGPAENEVSQAFNEMPEALMSVHQRLTAQGMDAKLVKKLVTACAGSLSPRALEYEPRVQNNIRQQLEAYIRTQKGTNEGKSILNNKVVCLIGPSGSGKTSMCAKLAAHYTKSLWKKVVWMCADTVRTGAIGLARAYTEPLGIRLLLAYTPEELAEAVEAEADADLILVDTPARNPRNEAELVELGAYLTILTDRATYLVMPATAKDSDMNDAVAAFNPFNLSGLIVTKLDETNFYGSSFNLAWRSQLPLVYFSDGPNVLNNLQPASIKQFTGLLFGEGLTKR